MNHQEDSYNVDNPNHQLWGQEATPMSTNGTFNMRNHSKMHKLKYDLARVNKLLDLRQKEFREQYKMSYDTIALKEAQVTSLVQSVQILTKKITTIQQLNRKGVDQMSERLQAEIQKGLLQDKKILVLKLNIQKVELQENLLQSKIHMLEQRLLNCNLEIMKLIKDKEDLHDKLFREREKGQETNNHVESAKSKFKDKEERVNDDDCVGNHQGGMHENGDQDSSKKELSCPVTFDEGQLDRKDTKDLCQKKKRHFWSWKKRKMTANKTKGS